MNWNICGSTKDYKYTLTIPNNVENRNSAFLFLASSTANNEEEKELLKKICEFATKHQMYVGDLVSFLEDLRRSTIGD